MKNVIATLALLACLDARAQIYNGQMYGQKQYGAWQGSLVTHGQDTRFRASAQSGNWTVYFDILPPSCDLAISASLWIGGDKMQQDIAKFDFPGALRVDQEDIWEMKYYTSAAMGDPAILFVAYKNKNIGSILAQMESGQQLMLKLAANADKPNYITIPLNGFTPALQHEQSACQYATTQPATAPSSTRKKPPKIGSDYF